jgi:26S proteasome regulatory subunit N7
MAPYYRLVTSTGALPPDEALLERLEAVNKDELAKLDERLAEAEKTEGESDIADALRARANHYTKLGDKVRPTRCGLRTRPS